MKNLSLIILVLVIFSSCKKNDPDPTADYPLAIIGKWKETQISVDYYASGQKVYSENQTTSANAYVEFKSNGSLEVDSLKNGAFIVVQSLNYTFTNSNTTLHVYPLSPSEDDGILFTNNNTMVLSTIIPGYVYYYDGVTTRQADSQIQSVIFTRY